jgi:hypothetical protein
MSKILTSAKKLHNFLYSRFWDGESLRGPDPGLGLNLRLYRFIKSAIPSARCVGKSYFLQTQGYWIKSNWLMYKLTENPFYKKIAIKCSEDVINEQRIDGSWKYPLRDWRNYVSTVEGTWASLGLIDSYRNTRNNIFLEAPKKWFDFLIKKTGFQEYENSLAVNYFAYSPKSRKVPNNNTLVLWLFSDLYQVTGNNKFLTLCPKLVNFLELTQRQSGELLYEIGHEHYLCYHYNCFEFIDLYNYYKTTYENRIKAILEKMANYIATGITDKGSVKHTCFQTNPEILMFSSAAGAALLNAFKLGFIRYNRHIELLYNYILNNQRPDGSFYYSRNDMVYFRKPISSGFLSDKNCYPGPMSYMLYHLLIKAEHESNASAAFKSKGGIIELEKLGLNMV